MKKTEFLGLKKKLLNNRGQFAIESVLLMTVLLGAFLAVTNYVKQKHLLSKLAAGPVANISTMVAFGTWKPDGCTAPGKSKQTIGKCHPNSIARSLSSNPNPL
jgi:hypothetical protein